MNAEPSDRMRQVPGPEAGDPPRGERDPSRPTATAPESVEDAVYEEAHHAGQQGPDAADPPTAARKSDSASADDADAELTSDLDPEERADVLETREEAHEIREAREDRDDDGLISLDRTD